MTAPTQSSTDYVAVLGAGIKAVDWDGPKSLYAYATTLTSIEGRAHGSVFEVPDAAGGCPELGGQSTVRSEFCDRLETRLWCHSAGCYALFVSAVLMSGFGGRIGGHIMPRVQLPAVTPKHRAWNKGRIIGQKRPLLPKQVSAIRARLELSGYLRDLALFNVAIDSKLRGCDLVKLAAADLVKDDRVRERVSIVQSKTKKPVQFEVTENTRDTVIAWVRSPEMIGCRFMFPSRFHDRPHISTRQYGRLDRPMWAVTRVSPNTVIDTRSARGVLRSLPERPDVRRRHGDWPLELVRAMVDQEAK